LGGMRVARVNHACAHLRLTPLAAIRYSAPAHKAHSPCMHSLPPFLPKRKGTRLPQCVLFPFGVGLVEVRVRPSRVCLLCVLYKYIFNFIYLTDGFAARAVRAFADAVRLRSRGAPAQRATQSLGWVCPPSPACTNFTLECDNTRLITQSHLSCAALHTYTTLTRVHSSTHVRSRICRENAEPARPRTCWYGNSLLMLSSRCPIQCVFQRPRRVDGVGK
jgi:hypothetical protein